MVYRVQATSPDDRGFTAEEFSFQFAELIRGELKRQDLTQADLARITGICECNISRLLNQKRPHLGHVRSYTKLFAALNLRVRLVIDET